MYRSSRVTCSPAENRLPGSTGQAGGEANLDASKARCTGFLFITVRIFAIVSRKKQVNATDGEKIWNESAYEKRDCGEGFFLGSRTRLGDLRLPHEL